jgi:hypothetical protein
MIVWDNREIIDKQLIIQGPGNRVGYASLDRISDEHNKVFTASIIFKQGDK